MYAIVDKHYIGKRASAKNVDKELNICYKCNESLYVLRNCPVKCSRLSDNNANYNGYSTHPGNGVQRFNRIARGSRPCDDHRTK